jgi:hypothetical protein
MPDILSLLCTDINLVLEKYSQDFQLSNEKRGAKNVKCSLHTGQSNDNGTRLWMGELGSAKMIFQLSFFCFMFTGAL